MDSPRLVRRLARVARRPGGIAIATALLVLTIISVIGLAIAAIGAQDLNLANADRNLAMSRYAAEAGIADGASQLLADAGWATGFSDKSLTTVPGVDLGYTVTVTNNVGNTARALTAADGTIVPPSMVYLYSTGTIRGTAFTKNVGALYHVLPGALFKYAAFGITSVNLGGTSSVSNSYDSSLGAYSTTNQSSTNCDVATSSTASGAITYSGGASNKGTAYAGYGGNPSTVINGAVPTNCNAMSSLSAPITLPIPVSPLVGSTTDLNVTDRTVTLQPGAYEDLTTPTHCTVNFLPGVYSFRNVAFGSQNTINMPASGKVVIYVSGTWDSSGGTIVNPQSAPSTFQINGTATCTQVKVTGGNSAYYCVNAPTADVTVQGNSDVYGAFNAKTVTIAGGGAVHYDVALRSMGTHNSYMALKYWKRY